MNAPRQKLAPTAVIGTWMNDDRTRGYQLQADGALSAIEREKPSDVWSPPATIGWLQDSIEPLQILLAGLTA